MLKKKTKKTKKNKKKQIHCATGPTYADSLALMKIIFMWSVLASSIGSRLEYTLNCLP